MKSVCALESCNRQVSSSIGHIHCAKHRACFNNSKYDPEQCDVCMAHWSNIRNDNEFALESKNIIKSLIRNMYD